MQTTDTESVLRKILDVTDYLSHFNDLDSILDHILFEARTFTGADAGSIYLLEDGKLTFTYVQNDTLFKSGASHKYLYLESILAFDSSSIAGHAAVTGKPIRINNVYRLPGSVPYTFNTDFDISTGYQTHSMLSIPLLGSQKKIIGVMSLINGLDHQQKPTTFCAHDELFTSTLAYHATVAIERAIMNREMIHRMLATSRLRDPMETGPHVNRVGAYSAEIYQYWARKNGIPELEMKQNRDTLRLAAMMHDIGKVAISDLILKKPGRLTREEFEVIKGHTIYGARLFSEGKSRLDEMSYDIALNHHERWDGKGYPGKIKDIHQEPIQTARGKYNNELSLFGSIVAIADVFDALSAKRVYKEPWPQEEVLTELENHSGSQFDPEIVDIFLEIYDVLDAIRIKYKDQEENI